MSWKPSSPNSRPTKNTSTKFCCTNGTKSNKKSLISFSDILEIKNRVHVCQSPVIDSSRNWKQKQMSSKHKKCKRKVYLMKIKRLKKNSQNWKNKKLSLLMTNHSPRCSVQKVASKNDNHATQASCTHQPGSPCPQANISHMLVWRTGCKQASATNANRNSQRCPHPNSKKCLPAKSHPSATY